MLMNLIEMSHTSNKSHVHTTVHTRCSVHSRTSYHSPRAAPSRRLRAPCTAVRLAMLVAAAAAASIWSRYIESTRPAHGKQAGHVET